MKDENELDEIFRELRKPNRDAVDRVITAALKPAAQAGLWKSGVLRFAMVSAGTLICVILLTRFPSRSPRMPASIAPDEPVLAKTIDQDVFLRIDGLLDKEVPSALEPAHLLTREVLKGEK